MFKLKIAGKHGGDQCAPYDIELDRVYTVDDFVKTVLSNRPNEWGYIFIDGVRTVFGDPCLTYSDGQIKSVSNEFKNFIDSTVKAAKASGGWTRMDYVLKVFVKGG
jgi:hypothetical protein